MGSCRSIIDSASSILSNTGNTKYSFVKSRSLRIRVEMFSIPKILPTFSNRKRKPTSSPVPFESTSSSSERSIRTDPFSLQGDHVQSIFFAQSHKSDWRDHILNQPYDTLPKRDRCLVCNRSRATCFCGFVTPFETLTRFVLLMHPKEYKEQTTGTGRLTHRALKNSELIMGVNLTENKRLNSLLTDPSFYPVILYPGHTSINLSQCTNFDVPPRKKLLIIILDGTWRLAKKIQSASANLHDVPRVCFTPPTASRFLIKRQPAKVCVSTIEATHHLLDILDKFGIEDLKGVHFSLLDAIDSLVRFQVNYMKDQNQIPRHVLNRQAREEAVGQQIPK